MDGGNGNACLGQCMQAGDGGMYTGTDIADGTALLLCIKNMCTGSPEGGEAGAPACQ
jgi:hypothetical protein